MTSHIAKVRAAIAAGGAGVVHAMNPVRVNTASMIGIDLDDPDSWSSSCATIAVGVDPLFAAVMGAIGATPRGRRTWSLSLADDADARKVAAVFDAIDPRMIITNADARESFTKTGGWYDARRSWTVDHVQDLLGTTSVGAHALTLTSWVADAKDPDAYQKGREFLAEGAVVIHIAAATLYFKVACAPLGFSGKIALDQLGLDTIKDPNAVDGQQLHMLAHHLHDRGIDVSHSPNVEAMLSRFPEVVLVGPSPLRPAQINTFHGADLGGELPVTQHQQSLSVLDDIIASSLVDGREVHVDPRVRDVVAMADALRSPRSVPGLRDYQNEAASLLATTNFGMVNASAPGLGKTPMTLAGWRLRAQDCDRWRGVVVCPAAIRSQWAEEIGRFFPEATVHVARSTADATAIIAALSSSSPCDGAGDGPLGREVIDADVPGVMVVVVSYEIMARAADAFCAHQWDAVCVDEAAVLRNHTTKRSRSLWQLRSNADVAVALTGTPIDRGLNDLGSLVAWSRNMPEWADGKGLGAEFSTIGHCEQTRADFADAMGPVLFRRDRSEVADELPAVSTEVVLIDPSGPELRLAEAARHELRRIYDELHDQLSQRIDADPDNPALADASATLSSARGAVLGGVTLARMAASDPAALVGSTAAGAALLEANSLITDAVAGGSTKRSHITGLVTELVDAGDAVLVFSDFPVVLGLLEDALECAGIACSKVVGGQSPRRRDADVARFQNGEVKVLLCSSAGNEGLNLQKANVVIHYDLPWNPSALIQRVGRAARLGGENTHLSVLIPIMAGTIEERVAAVLVPRAATAVAALDLSRGKSSSETEIGVALSGLVDAAESGELAGNMLAMARSVLGDDD